MSFGIGLGAFMQGVGQGATTMANIQQQKSRQKLYDLQLGEAEQDAADRTRMRDLSQQGVQDARAARTSDINSRVQDMGMGQWKVGDQTYNSQGDAQQAAAGSVDSFLDYYTRTSLPRIQEEWINQGDVQKAQELETWMQDRETQRGMRSWAEMVRSYQTGDEQGFLKNLQDTFNNQGYAGGNLEATGIEPSRNDQGQITGYSVAFRNRDTGESSSQNFDGEDLQRMAVSAMSPEQIFESQMAEQAALREARGDMAKENRERSWEAQQTQNEQQFTLGKLGVEQGYSLERQNNQSALDRAEEAEKARNGGANGKVGEARAISNYLRDMGYDDSYINAVAPRLLGIEAQQRPSSARLDDYVEVLSRSDMSFSRLSTEDKVQKARELMSLIDQASQAPGLGSYN